LKGTSISKGGNDMRKNFLMILIFGLMIGALIYGMNYIQATSNEKQLENLENSIRCSTVQCYALEGRYPESIEYLKEYYGVSYDEDKYFVDYVVQSSNLMPDITVIVKK
jgi:hypothetical protein